MAAHAVSHDRLRELQDEQLRRYQAGDLEDGDELTEAIRAMMDLIASGERREHAEFRRTAMRFERRRSMRMDVALLERAQAAGDRQRGTTRERRVRREAVASGSTLRGSPERPRPSSDDDDPHHRVAAAGGVA